MEKMQNVVVCCFLAACVSHSMGGHFFTFAQKKKRAL
jgi:hypothetical protein